MMNILLFCQSFLCSKKGKQQHFGRIAWALKHSPVVQDRVLRLVVYRNTVQIYMYLEITVCGRKPFCNYIVLLDIEFVVFPE